ncbi:MAG: ABC transporter substrate-binding protein [Anaerolineae bacterium]|nr:ABC transporter substrate-binding protein [Anaerolineae bacterium]
MKAFRISLCLLIVSALLITAGASFPVQARQAEGTPLIIGVIGVEDSPTARGIQIAAQRLNARGLFNIGGTGYTIQVLARPAATLDELTLAIAGLKESGAVAIFGPNEDSLAKAGNDLLAAAEVPVFIGATDVDVKTGGTLFRTRATDDVMMNALADVLVNDLQQQTILIFQGSEDYSGKVSALRVALTERGIDASTLIQTGDTPMEDVAKSLVEGNSNVIAAFGLPGQVTALLPALHAAGFTGTFVTDALDDPTWVETLPETERDGLYSVTNWTYGSIRQDSIDFTDEYKLTFNDVEPWGLSAAAYDAAVALCIAFQRVGSTDPEAGIAQLLRFTAVDSLQGTFDPSLGGGLLNLNANVIVTSEDGTPSIVARYNGEERLLPENVTPTPTVTNTATNTPTATATLDGVYATVTGTTLNVRSGPGMNYNIVGKLKRGDVVRVIGALPDFSWLLIPFEGGQAWILAQFVTISGDRSTVPIIAVPPTPSGPTATVPPTGEPTADIVFVSATFNPPVPQPNVPFTLAVTIMNQGSVAAPEFAVATSFKPGEVYTAAVVPGLAAGQQTVVNLTATLAGTGVETISVVLDLNQQVNEGIAGETNNQPTVSYRIDRPYMQQSSSTLPPGQNVDFDGGGADVTFSGASLDPSPGSALIQLQIPFTSVHYDQLASIMGSVANGTSSIGGPPAPGVIIGVRTTSGKIGVIQVTGYSGSSIQFNFYIYN